MLLCLCGKSRNTTGFTISFEHGGTVEADARLTCCELDGVRVVGAAGRRGAEMMEGRSKGVCAARTVHHHLRSHATLIVIFHHVESYSTPSHEARIRVWPLPCAHPFPLDFPDRQGFPRYSLPPAASSKLGRYSLCRPDTQSPVPNTHH
jgi:hypothetical protein